MFTLANEGEQEVGAGRRGGRGGHSAAVDAAVVGAVVGEDGPQVPLAEDQDAVVSSVLAVSTNRSVKQFAMGHRGGIFTVAIPAPAVASFEGVGESKEVVS
jgi:hypothetical protein